MRDAVRVRARGGEDPVVVGVVKYYKPSAVPLVAEPVIHEAEDISLWIIPAGQLDLGGNIRIGLLKSGGVARMHPKHPGLGCRLSHPVRIFDSNLRLPSQSMSVSRANKSV